MSKKSKFNLDEYSEETNDVTTEVGNPEPEPVVEQTSEPEPVVENKPEPVKEEKSEDKKETPKKSPEVSKGSPIRTSVAIEPDLIDAITAGAGKKYKGNKSAYINALVRADYEANKKAYDAFLKLLS